MSESFLSDFANCYLDISGNALSLSLLILSFTDLFFLFIQSPLSVYSLILRFVNLIHPTNQLIAAILILLVNLLSFFQTNRKFYDLLFVALIPFLISEQKFYLPIIFLLVSTLLPFTYFQLFFLANFYLIYSLLRTSYHRFILLIITLIFLTVSGEILLRSSPFERAIFQSFTPVNKSLLQL